MFDDVCFHIVIDMKHAKKINDFKKNLKNCVHKSEFMINDYEV